MEPASPGNVDPAQQRDASSALVSRRSLVAGALACVATGAGAYALRTDGPANAASSPVSDMLLAGFEGRDVASASAQQLAAHLRNGRAAGVIFVRDNIGGPEQLAGLIELFQNGVAVKPLLAIDQEGGAVHRLGLAHGVPEMPSAYDIGRGMPLDEMFSLYASAASAMARIGFNLNLGPVADLHDAGNAAVGAFGRAYASEPDRVAECGQVFIKAFTSAGVGCVLKHFPGQGGRALDTHTRLPDMRSNWSERDLEPFARLIREDAVDAVMSGHGAHDIENGDLVPAAVSARIVSTLLRDRLGFAGVAMTDDLDMGALGFGLRRREAVLRALAAGNNLMIVRNRRNHDPGLPASVAAWTHAAIATGYLDREKIAAASGRARNYRERLAPGQAGQGGS